MSKRGSRAAKPEADPAEPSAAPGPAPGPAPAPAPPPAEAALPAPSAQPEAAGGPPGRLSRSIKPAPAASPDSARGGDAQPGPPRKFAPNLAAGKPIAAPSPFQPVAPSAAAAATSPNIAPHRPASTTPLAPRAVPKPPRQPRPALAVNASFFPPPAEETPVADDLSRPSGLVPIDFRNAHHPIPLPLPTSKLLRHKKQDAGLVSDLAHPAFMLDMTEAAQDNPDLFFVQLPSLLPLPLPTRPAPPVGDAMDLDEEIPAPAPDVEEATDEGAKRKIPPGKIGRLRVRQSGAMELVVGDIVFDVTQGFPLAFLQELVVLNDPAKTFQSLGTLSKRLVVNPNIESLLAQTAIGGEAAEEEVKAEAKEKPMEAKSAKTAPAAADDGKNKKKKK